MWRALHACSFGESSREHRAFLGERVPVLGLEPIEVCKCIKTLASRLEIEGGVISSVSGTCVPGGPHNSYQISPHPGELQLEPIGVRFDR